MLKAVDQARENVALEGPSVSGHRCLDSRVDQRNGQPQVVDKVPIVNQHQSLVLSEPGQDGIPGHRG